jgi:hypothetical protein
MDRPHADWGVHGARGARSIHRTFFDACLFLRAVPLIAIKALTRDWLWLSILLYLP